MPWSMPWTSFDSSESGWISRRAHVVREGSFVVRIRRVVLEGTVGNSEMFRRFSGPCKYRGPGSCESVDQRV